MVMSLSSQPDCEELDTREHDHKITNAFGREQSGIDGGAEMHVELLWTAFNTS